MQPQAPPQPKQKVIALVLAAIPPTAVTGIHYFYLGWNHLGIIRCACLALACCAPVPFIGQIIALCFVIASFAWYLVDIIRIATGSLKPADGSELV